MILVSKSKTISAEYRFFIVASVVITGSMYMLNGEPMVSPITDHGCMRVASQIASESFQIDNAYCCDVGIVNGLPKVIELNYFSAAGFYACDVEKLFEAVGKEAERDYLDIMGD